jgi:hypothetical protein
MWGGEKKKKKKKKHLQLDSAREDLGVQLSPFILYIVAQETLIG